LRGRTTGTETLRELCCQQVRGTQVRADDLFPQAAGVDRHARRADEGISGDSNEVERSQHIEDGLDQGSGRSGPFADLRRGLRGGELVEDPAFEGARERAEGPHGKAKFEDPLALLSARETDFRFAWPAGGLWTRAIAGLLRLHESSLGSLLIDPSRCLVRAASDS
jgi:hypothetical protein